MNNPTQTLTALGLKPETAVVRSSGAELALDNPFLYFLIERLGLRKYGASSEALTDGSWFHVALEVGTGSEYQARINQRLEEIRASAKVHGVSHDRLQDWLRDERESALAARAWFDIAYDYALPGGSVRQRFKDYTILARESLHTLPIQTETGEKANIVVQFDQVLYNPKQHSVCALDAKTTQGSCFERSESCPFEFQSLLYCYALREILKPGVFDLPADPRPLGVEGIKHWIIRKPQIRPCSEDIPFREVSRVLKSGPNKGQTRIDKEPIGTEPSFDLYLQRCERWYRAEGQYAHLKPTWDEDPPTNISTSYLSHMPLDSIQFTQPLHNCARLATMTPDPDLFLKRKTGVFDRKGYYRSYAPFFTEPVRNWPRIVEVEGFVRDFSRNPLVT